MSSGGPLVRVFGEGIVHVMKAILLCNSPMAIPALHALVHNDLLAGVCVPAIEHAANDHAIAVSEGSGAEMLVVEAADVDPLLTRWVESIDADVLFCVGFPYRIPEPALERVTHGGWNFHPSPLPRYRGPDPLYWQLRNGETMCAMTVHRIEGGMDAGPIAVQIEIPIDESDCYGTLLGRMSLVAGEALGHMVQNLEAIAIEPQDESAATSQSRPEPHDWVIDWNASSARQVHDLVRATNPQYGGALAFLQGSEVRVLESELVADAGKGGAAEATHTPGTIITAGGDDGLVVACANDSLLSIRIAYLEQGVFTAERLVKLFDLQAGVGFDRPPQ